MLDGYKKSEVAAYLAERCVGVWFVGGGFLSYYLWGCG